MVERITDEKKDAIQTNPLNLGKSSNRRQTIIKIHDLGIPETPFRIEEVVPASPIDYNRIDKKTKEQDPTYKKEGPIISAFAAATDAYRIGVEDNTEEEEFSDEELMPLDYLIQSSLERSIPFLLEVKAGTYKIFQSAQRAFLPETNRRKTLMLDLDNTLVCAFYDESIKTAAKAKHTSKHFKFPYVTRPFLRTFLEEMDKHYEIWVYTAGETDYAQDMVSSIDPLHKYFRGALTRSNCALLEMHEGGVMGMKNLSVISNRNKENTIIVDDTIHAWPNDLSNLVPIEAFHGDHKDRGLKHILQLLIELSKCKDIRTGIQERIPLIMNCKKLMDAATK